MKKTLILLALATSLLAGSGCSVTIPFGSGSPPNEVKKQNYTKIRPYTTSEKAWLVGMAGCQIADYYTTRVFLDNGLEEGNPLFGKHPSDEKIRNAKILAILLFSLGGHFDPENRETIYKIGAGFGCAAAVWNDYQTKKYVN